MAIAAAGIMLPAARAKSCHGRWTSESIIEAILECAVNRQSLLSSKIRPSYLRTAAVRIFGSWDNALNAAGVEISGIRYNKWSQDRIKNELLLRLNEGKSLYPRDIQKDSPKLRAAMGRWFDDWADAFLHAGICPGLAQKNR